MDDENFNEMIRAKDGWRHVSIDKWVKVENGVVTKTQINTAFLDCKLEYQRPPQSLSASDSADSL